MTNSVWIDVLPSVGGFAKDLVKGVGGAAKTAGVTGGKEYSAAFDGGAKGAGAAAVKELENAQKTASGSVKKLAGEVSGARQAQQKSAADLLTAEQRLTDATEKYGAESNQAQAAALRVEAARGKAAQATEKFENAESALKEGQTALKKTTEQLETAQEGLTEEVKEAPGLWGKLKTSMGETREVSDDTQASFTALKDAAKVGFAAIAAGAVAVAGGGAALYKVGEIFDGVHDTIRAGTGATGDDLDDLLKSVQNLGGKIPHEFDAIGTTVADVNTRLGLTGDTLEGFASQVLEAGRLMGEDLNINDLGGAFNQFRIEGDDLSDAMDHMFRVSQGTGIGINDLAKRVEKYAPTVQNLGFSFEDSAAMIGLFDRAGLDADGVMAGMTKGLVTLAKAGEEPKDAFQRVVGEIGSFVDQGNEAAALDLASQVFGVRGASQFVASIQSGTLAMDDLATNSLFTSDTILGVADDTNSFAEKWMMFKNNVLTKLEPVASRVFEMISGFMDWVSSTGVPAAESLINVLFKGDYDGGLAALGLEEDHPFIDFLFNARDAALGLFGYIQDTAVPALKDAGGWIVKNKDWLLAIGVGLGTVALAWGAWTLATKTWTTVTNIAKGAQAAFNLVMSANPITVVILAVAALVAGLVYFFTKTETGKKAWAAFTDALGKGATWLWEKAIKPAWDAITAGWDAVVGAFKYAWNSILKPVFTAIGDSAKFLWEKAIKPAWDAIKTGWDNLTGGLKVVWDTVLKPVFDTFKNVIKGDLPGAFESGKQAIEGIWNLIKGIAAKPINFVIDTVYNKGLRAAINKVRGIVGGSDLPALATIPAYAKGGQMQHGWKLVGEEGPELINTGPGYVYTAQETKRMLTGAAQAPLGALGTLDGSTTGKPVLPIGGIADGIGSAASWVAEKASAAGQWIRGGLAKAAGYLLDPLKNLISNNVPSTVLGDIARSASTQAIDKALDWIRGKDEEVIDGESFGDFTGSRGGFARPSRGPITSRFGPRWGAHHAGVDIAGGGPTYAAWGGRVQKTGWNVLGGRTGIGIILNHGKGLHTYYGHNPVGGVLVKPGQEVKAGQRIGAQGATGNVTGIHLHFEKHVGRLGNAVNPIGHLYDRGGVIPRGVTTVVNKTRQPEVIYTHAQHQALVTLADKAAAQMDDPGARIIIHQTNHNPVSVPTPVQTRRALEDVATLGVLG